jgi:hypothetical protein
MGDSPAYAMQAQAYAHGTDDISWALRADIHKSWDGYLLRRYPELYPGPHGLVSPFGAGLSVLLTPFIGIRNLVVGGTLGMVVLCTAGLIVLHRRASRLAGLSAGGQVLLAVIFAWPALLLAETQIYPDLLSGVFLAAALLELAIIEERRKVTTQGALIITASAVVLPWLQVKNLGPSMVLSLILAVMAVRFRPTGSYRVATYSGLAIILVSWAALRWYNVHFFGHLLGFPEPPVRFSKRGIEYTLGLLFDRQQGLFVQVPVAVLGLMGLWMGRRKHPVAVCATVGTLGILLILNGTYTINPYGGSAFAGRFMWTLVPALLVWVAVVMRSWKASARRLRMFASLVGLVWVYQAWPIVTDKHVYHNAFRYFQKPHLVYPGWWQGLNSLIPQFNLPGHVLGAPSWGLVLELAVGMIFVGGTSLYLKTRQRADFVPELG